MSCAYGRAEEEGWPEHLLQRGIARAMGRNCSLCHRRTPGCCTLTFQCCRLRRARAREGTTLRLSAYGRRVAQHMGLPAPSAGSHAQPVRYDFRYGLPDVMAFPHET